jgi:hypothetical protein
MNDDTYKLRTKVMGYIYEAKKLSNLPRLDVRITDLKDNSDPRILGTARMNDNILWIPAKTLTEKDSVIRHVVLHEILHAAHGIDHDESCPLMSSTVGQTTTKEQNEAFIKHCKPFANIPSETKDRSRSRGRR